MFAAEFEPVEPDSHRRSPRAPVSLDAEVDNRALGRTLCKVVDVSLHGVRLSTYSTLRRGQAILLTLPRIGPIAAQVRWADDFTAGCRFHKALTRDQLDLLLDGRG